MTEKVYPTAEQVLNEAANFMARYKTATWRDYERFKNQLGFDWRIEHSEEFDIFIDKLCKILKL